MNRSDAMHFTHAYPLAVHDLSWTHLVIASSWLLSAVICYGSVCASTVAYAIGIFLGPQQQDQAIQSCLQPCLPVSHVQKVLNSPPFAGAPDAFCYAERISCSTGFKPQCNVLYTVMMCLMQTACCHKQGSGLPRLQAHNAHTMSELVVLQLNALDVSNNTINGTLPRSWGNLTQASTTSSCSTSLAMHFTLRPLSCNPPTPFDSRPTISAALKLIFF